MLRTEFDSVMGGVFRLFATWPRKEMIDSYWHVLQHYSIDALRAAVETIKDDDGIKKLPLPVELARLTKRFACSVPKNPNNNGDFSKTIITRQLTILEKQPIKTARMQKQIERLTQMLEIHTAGYNHVG